MVDYVIGDIHGRYHALTDVLIKSEFDFEKDLLITLGDTCDGGQKTRECFDLLLSIPNRIDVVGNHEKWFLDWLNGGNEFPLWVHQGGHETLRSYDFDRNNVPRAHKELIENARTYYVDKKKNIFVHGGFNPIIPIENQTREFITWDRTLIKYAREHKIRGYKHVFVGHTSTQIIDKSITNPVTFNNLTMCDCGGGYTGRLAMVNVDTLEYFVSDMQIPRYEPLASYI
jgi:serine/threonine protein phosphatase 1